MITTRMGEQRWLRCGSPAAMLSFLRGRASERKLRLFASACVRRLWQLLHEPPRRRQLQRDCRAVQASELFADDLLNRAALDAARRAILIDFKDVAGLSASPSLAAYLAAGDPTLPYHRSCALAAKHTVACGALHGGEEEDIEARRQARLLRELFGPLPFREVDLEPAWLAWCDGLVPRLAEAIYHARRWPHGTLCCERLGVLADALEETGCDDADILDHLRGPGPHVSGCWVIDRLTGRK
jgi:hypothetical protein